MKVTEYLKKNKLPQNAIDLNKIINEEKNRQ